MSHLVEQESPSVVFDNGDGSKPSLACPFDSSLAGTSSGDSPAPATSTDTSTETSTTKDKTIAHHY